MSFTPALNTVRAVVVRTILALNGSPVMRSATSEPVNQRFENTRLLGKSTCSAERSSMVITGCTSFAGKGLLSTFTTAAASLPMAVCGGGTEE